MLAGVLQHAQSICDAMQVCPDDQLIDSLSPELAQGASALLAALGASQLRCCAQCTLFSRNVGGTLSRPLHHSCAWSSAEWKLS